MENPNALALDCQFLTPAGEVAGIKLQPLSPGVITICRKFAFYLVVGTEEQKKTLTEEQSQYQLMAVMFMLACPRDTLLALVDKGEDSFKAEVRKFEFLIPLSEMNTATVLLQKIIAEANKAVVETVAKPPGAAADSESTPPPNS